MFGIDIDKHASDIVRAYSYASQTSNGVDRDGFSIDNLQVRPVILSPFFPCDC